MAGSIGADIRAGRLPLITRRAWRTLPERTADAIVERVPQDPPETDLVMLDPDLGNLDRSSKATCRSAARFRCAGRSASPSPSTARPSGGPDRAGLRQGYCGT